MKEKIMLIKDVIAFLIILAGIMAGVNHYQTTRQTEIEVTPTVTMTPAPTSEPIDLKGIAGYQALQVSMKFEEYLKEMETEEYYDDLEMLAYLVQAEAGNQSFYGKQLVVDVVLNRVDSPNFPDTVEGVITQKNQFDVWTTGAIWNVIPDEETYQAVASELQSRQNYDVLFFRTNHYFDFGTPILQFEDHYFSGE